MCVLILAASVSPVLGSGILGTVTSAIGSLWTAPRNLVAGVFGYGDAESSEEDLIQDPEADAPKWMWSKFQFDDISGSVTRLLRPWIKHYKLTGLNDFDEVIKDVTDQVLELLETEVLSRDMIAPLADLFENWVDALPKTQRIDFFVKAIFPNVKELSSISRPVKWFVGGWGGCLKLVHKATAKKIKRKINEYREIARNKLRLQRSQPIQQRLEWHSADNVALGSAKAKSGISKTKSADFQKLKAELKTHFNGYNRRDTHGKLQIKKIINDIINDVDVRMRRVLEVVTKHYDIRDVNFDLDNFWSKVLRNLLEPFLGMVRYRSRCQKCGGDGKRKGWLLRKRNKTCNTCGGSGLQGDAKIRPVASILNRFRDETVATIMWWFDHKLPADQKYQLVNTIINSPYATARINIKLGWFEAIPGAGWAIKAAGANGVSYTEKGREWLKDWINGYINSKIEECEAILVPQVARLQVASHDIRTHDHPLNRL